VLERCAKKENEYKAKNLLMVTDENRSGFYTIFETLAENYRKQLGDCLNIYAKLARPVLPHCLTLLV
jgi:hypothetical protein